jgi:hypothetical protein
MMVVLVMIFVLAFLLIALSGGGDLSKLSAEVNKFLYMVYPKFGYPANGTIQAQTVVHGQEL